MPTKDQKPQKQKRSNLNSPQLALMVSLIAALFSTACGPSKSALPTSSTTQGSRLPSTPPTNGNAAVADCNGATNASLEMEFQLSSYYIPGTGQASMDLIRMNFSQIPGKIITSDTHYIQLYRWYEDTPGQRVLNPAPVKFYFQSRTTGKLINSDDPQDKISKAIIQNMIVMEKDRGGAAGVSLNNFFQAYVILLTAMDIQFDAMTTALYNTDKGTAAIGWQDALIPGFHSNPNTYAASHAAPSLQQLHPNWASRQSNLSEQDYFNNTEKFCQKFL